MNEIERIYRTRRQLLIGAFVCSVVLFLFFISPFILVTLHIMKKYDPALTMPIFKIVGILSFVLLLILFTRYIVFRITSSKDPVLRKTVDDERIKISWLKAYRIAFLTMAGIHVFYLFGENFAYERGFPHAVWLSASVGLMILFGSSVMFSREMK